ncbi:DUF4347 domain-containing protein [Paraburkholderia sp. NMBU_R16]|uniref:DUF4347 domain-containing protein n=1 Tax=Paraburkholderia sp. NMBU_R16 TaxID=2698676 RepID=UPI0015638E65|nr:DUF4347 domain-containing protein [Paraburkholderia sp. NMBU_R16]NRO96572.1 DUF4347 domain-containing protein [Paraburkholderia sp. NMBU_R16]
MRFAASLSKLLSAVRGSATTARRECTALPAPLIVALEPRIVYDASAAAIGVAAAAAPHPTNVDGHAASTAHEGPSASTSTRAVHGFTPAAVAAGQGEAGAQNAAATARHGYMSTPFSGVTGDAAATRAVHGFTDSAAQSLDRQVVFINSNVADLQTLVAGLPAGTQYVVLDSTKDGLVQIEQYLQAHPGVSAIHLVSHGATGEFQVGSTWINEADMSTYSAEFAQIGASMKAGGDFLIYGCDVAGNADGKALVQQISSISGLNVAASTDATGAASLGGDWSLEYDAGTVHAGVIFSTASEQNYGHVLSAFDETYDGWVGFDTGATPVASTTLDGLTYTGDQAVEYQVVSGSLPSSGSGGEFIVNTQGTQMSSLTIQRQDGTLMAVESFDIDIFVSNQVTVQALDGSGNVVGSIVLDFSAGATAYTPGHVSNNSLFHVDLSSNAAFSQVKSIKLIETSGNGTFLSPTLDNFTYLAPSSPPTLTATGGTTSFVAGDNTASTPVAVDSGITLTDGNSSTAVSATVSITGNLHNSEDVLAFTNTSAATYGNISAGYNAVTGVLTLTSSGGTATIAQWQAALRAVTYTDTAVTPNALTRTISFEVTNDGLTSGNTTTKQVSVTDTDQTPIVTTSSSAPNYREGAPAITIDSGVSVSDRDNTTQSSGTVSISTGFHSGDSLSFTNTSSATFGNIAASYNAATGVLTLTSSGATATDVQWGHALSAVTFSSTSTTLGSRTISFATSDGAKTSTAATDTVDVLTPIQVTTDSGSAAFVAGDNTASTPVAVDSGLTVSDTAATTLASATVAITGGFQSTQDVLGFTNDGSTMGNITSSYNAATGVLTLTSAGASATLAQWQSALRSVTYTDTAVTPNNTTRTLSFTAVDGVGNTSAAATRTVTVTDTDQTPIVVTTGGTTSYVGASSAVTIDGGVSVADLDNTTQSSGTVSVSSGFHSGDTLAFTNTSSAAFGNIVGSYNAATGVLTLTSSGATATDAQWASALSSVTFSSTSTTYGNRTISFATSDGTKTSAAATDTVGMIAPPQITTDSGSASFVAADNAASTPVAIDAGLTVTDGSATTLNSATVAITGGFHSGEDVLAFTNDSATMGNITASYNATTGVMTLTSAGATATLAQWQSALESVTYTDTAVTPNTATRTISFAAIDGAGNSSATATRTVTITDTDQTPIVTTTGGTTNYVGGTSAVTIDGGIAVSDLDNTTQSTGTISVTSGFHSGDTLTFVNTSSATFGNIAGSYNAATGVLTLTSSGSTATNAQWASVLSAVTFSAGSSATPGNRTISFAVSDGIKSSAVQIDTVDVLGPPTITTDSGSASFVAGDNATSTPVAIDAGLTLTDGVSSTLASTTVTITGGFHSGEDVLGFTNTSATTYGNIAGSYNAATGVLTLTSSGASATLAQWQAALQAVTYTDTAITPNNTTRTISFTAVDTGAFTSNTATRTVTVTDTDQTPIVSVAGGTTNYVAGASAVTIDGAITVSDNDNTTQSVGTVSITTGLQSGDTLTFINTSSATFGNIVGSYNAATGVLTLTSSGATASDAQWSSALSAVTFSAGSSATPGNRTIGFAVSDGTKTSPVANDTVAVLGPPTITTDSGSASFVAGDNATSTPVAIDSGLSVTDGGASTLASATVSITGNFHSGEDVLAFVNTSLTTYGNIAASYNAATGVLTLNSAGATATLAQWQAALDSVTYTDTAITPNTATRTISFTAVDTGAVTSNTATRTVTVADTDQTPVVAAAGGTTSYVAGASATIVNPGVSVTDLDNPTQASATVAVTGNFHGGEDILTFTNSNATTFGNIAATYDSATGVLTLNSAGATATDAQWANALSAVTFSTSGTHFGNRTISFATSDGSKTSAAANTTLVVLDQPHITPDAGSGSFVAADNATSTPIAVSPGLTLTDASSATASSASVAITGGFHSGEDVLAFTNDNATMGNIAASYNASTGVLTLTSAGATASLTQWRAALASVTYTDTAVVPDTTTRVISFKVTDGNGAVSTAQTRSVTVTATDQTPLVSVGGSVTFTSLGARSTPVAIAPQVTVSDRDPNATLSSAQVTISGGFDASNDMLAFTGSAATGNIAATYNAATGVLTLTSAGGTASLAQWQAALQSVTYSDAKSGASGSRTVAFTVSDGVKTSAVASNTITIVTGQTGIVPVFPTPPTVIESPAAAQPPLFTGSDLNGAPDVLDEFDEPLPVGSVPIVPTMTFSDPSAPRNMQPLDRASVSRFDAAALDAAIAVGNAEALVPLPDVSFAMGPNDPFSIEVATLLPPSEAMHGGSDVTVRLANGRSLPGWIHYDAASGVLRGRLPPGAQDVHIVIQARDASGHETRRQIVLAPHDKHGSSHDKRSQHDQQHGQDKHGVVHPSPQGHTSRAPAEPSVARAARPVGKPSLDQQFAQARAALHVSHPGGATRRV